jgi:hypothetical protein
MRTARGRAAILLAAAAWTIWVWTTRIWNIANDPAHGFGFKAVHTVLAVVSIAFAVAVGLIGLRLRREARAAAVPQARQEPAPAVREAAPPAGRESVGR